MMLNNNYELFFLGPRERSIPSCPPAPSCNGRPYTCTRYIILFRENSDGTDLKQSNNLCIVFY